MVEDNKTIDVLLFGLGAIGSFYAFILDRNSNVRLTVCARSNYNAVRSNGFTIDSHNHGKHHVNPYKVVKDPAEANATFDYIVCTNKAVDVDSVVKQLGPVIAEKSSTIVILQNGVGNEDPYRAAFPYNTIISCVVWVGASQPKPGVVYHTVAEGTELGLYPNASIPPELESQRLSTFTNLLESGGSTSVTVKENIQISRWEKVIWNIAWNTLTTLTQTNTHFWLYSSPEAIPMTRRLMREATDIAIAVDVPLNPNYELVDRLMQRILSIPGLETSMSTDAKMGRPMEVDAILGAPVRMAREKGVSVPTMETIYAIILGINARLIDGRKTASLEA